MLGLSQATYIDQILARFNMVDSKKGFVPFRVGITLLGNQCPKTSADRVNEKNFLCFGSGKCHVSHVMYKTRHLLCRWHG